MYLEDMYYISMIFILNRIRDPPTYETLETGFQMSFKFRVPDDNHGVTYFAFTYPYMYKELQLNIDKMHRRYSNGHRKDGFRYLVREPHHPEKENKI